MATTNTHIPLEIVQGTTVSWASTFNDYPSTTWAASIVIRNAGLKVECNATAGDDGAFAFVVPATTSATLHAGHYEYAIAVTKDDERYIAESGRVVVLPDIAADQPLGVSGKSPVRVRYEFYQDLLTNESFVKTLEPGRIEELEMNMRRMQWELKREEDAEKARRGENTTRKLYARFA